LKRAHIFLQWQYVKHSCHHFPVTYKNYLVNLKFWNWLSPQILLWLLMIGAVLIFTEPDGAWLKPWLRLNIKLCEVESWSEMQVILKSFI